MNFAEEIVPVGKGLHQCAVFIFQVHGIENVVTQIRRIKLKS